MVWSEIFFYHMCWDAYHRPENESDLTYLSNHGSLPCQMQSKRQMTYRFIGKSRVFWNHADTAYLRQFSHCPVPMYYSSSIRAGKNRQEKKNWLWKANIKCHNGYKNTEYSIIISDQYHIGLVSFQIHFLYYLQRTLNVSPKKKKWFYCQLNWGNSGYRGLECFE